MRDLLFLSHRIPYPPDKGEKIRAWHMFLHLARTHRMHLGCFIDDPADWAHLETVRARCADIACFGLNKRRQRLRALLTTRPGQPLSAGYFRDARLRDWVRAKLASGIDRVFVYCSAMAPYITETGHRGGVLDMVDIDSEKWREYAARARFPAKLVWAREGRTLLALERRAAGAFDRSLFVSRAECDRFAELAPESRSRIGWLDNGVDLQCFAPTHDWSGSDNPRRNGSEIVFTGTMDYWPNVDAVTWFAADILPGLRADHPGLGFTIVGANPSPDVQRLATLPGVTVTGRVADVRPYVARADVVVAPLRIARGIQNKVLEAMAMGRPVVASPQAFEGIRAMPGRDLLVADGAAAIAVAVREVLAGRHPDLPAAARRAMEAGYAWTETLAGLDDLLPPDPSPVSHPQPERVV